MFLLNVGNIIYYRCKYLLKIPKFMIHPPTVIIRHRKENRKKCSLRGLDERQDFIFYHWPAPEIPQLKDYFYLDMEGPPLSQEEAHLGLLAIDGTWLRAEKMTKQLTPLLQTLKPRSIPATFRTAYPRKQTACIDPERGLATLEALYIAYRILDWPVEGLLDHYHFAKEFLAINESEFLGLNCLP